MKSSNQVEIAAGIFLLLGIAALIFLAVQATDTSGIKSRETYAVNAYFTNIGGLKIRAPVAMAGVTIGRVDSIELDQETLEARVVMQIDTEYDDLPSDTSASVLTSGILGDQYVGLEPGGAPDALNDGDRILLTNSAVVLEQLIGRYLFNTEEEDE
ncbi:MAG: outer membrane lipid asymmetry maintenance protein MlaD [Wenzhouxiangellaceae bacterium]|jgi:phospholipid/cholesterol/gamma-HCH transport system substrate-binding protein|nr:outer membrane lipid asymmetry maintenance protein MlaD [Wenzhouxiangellaceae bacterium]MBS3745505.1 outer membrane lipid asymmetry maintenance protein MlaD [Wenzhouxiangellaceae bacterium]MBS3823122.1 outer membrane lipid asymmetry maintenance protein MlaD [Wenzhouxiangellaceae bacterium]